MEKEKLKEGGLMVHLKRILFGIFGFGIFLVVISTPEGIHTAFPEEFTITASMILVCMILLLIICLTYPSGYAIDKIFEAIAYNTRTKRGVK